jgi:hypothetical protein
MKIEEGRCVYALFNPITKLTKIGVTDNIETRKNTLELACGCRLELIHITRHLLRGEKYEVDAHRELSQYRVMGEWFNLPAHGIVIETIDRVIESATQDAIVEDYRKGVSISKLALEYEVTRQAILARLKKYGVYDSQGRIFEKDPDAAKLTGAIKPKPNTSEHISSVDDSYDETTYLDGEIPDLPLSKLKRLESNINFNGEWYQISIFKDGEFIYSYTRDLNKARAYVQGVRAINFANTNKRPVSK